ncbi:hypothetical protein JDV02_005675 [Purpureocillium takamizusanense]|uniref:Dyp-type peroxidase n=1 Tax=Purpureocillium takamizusanense TaxID=2060973 RepID=A0A9Q8QGK3_9HYPO|nr:uncharacterized protein JDV02_005675 [Purpureocillium takamizusanense]UNI19493.1 hypothetical protein JDV02_005675 [Purpureocillium takamizusanense]
MDRVGRSTNSRIAIQLLHAGNNWVKARSSRANRQFSPGARRSCRRALWSYTSSSSFRGCRSPAQSNSPSSSSSHRPLPPPPPLVAGPPTTLVAAAAAAAAPQRRRYLLHSSSSSSSSAASETAAAAAATMSSTSTSRCPASSTARQLAGTASQAQALGAPLTQSATFLVLSIATRHRAEALQTIRATLAGIEGLAKNVTIRDSTSTFSCAVGIGSDAWDDITGGRLPRPAELHPFRPVRGAVHTAVATPGDLLLHIRSDRRDICFEFERQLMKLLGDAVIVEDVTVGFRYFDLRDLLGFVDGTANPVGPAVPDSVLIADEDASAAGGSYVVVQKYVHNLKGWERLSTEQQEAIIGRTKLDNMELDDAEQGQKAHKTLATVEDEQGNEHDILRDNMPFGSPGNGEFGTYFIGYSRRLWVMEKMLERMFVGDPPGLHDRILDYSRPMTGTTFYAPPAAVLTGLGDR